MDQESGSRVHVGICTTLLVSVCVHICLFLETDFNKSYFSLILGITGVSLDVQRVFSCTLYINLISIFIYFYLFLYIGQYYASQVLKKKAVVSIFSF